MKQASFFLTVVCLAAAAAGQNLRSAVSVGGIDTNDCTVPNPCRTFNRAVSVTNSGGELIALDSGGYGPFTIDRSITIRPVPGAYAGLAPTGGAGITITAPGANVVLRGLTVNGLGAFQAVLYTSAAMLHIEDCAFDRLLGSAIFQNGGTGNLMVTDTSITNSSTAIQVSNAPAAGVHDVTLANLRIDKCSTAGIRNTVRSRLTISDTSITNSNSGLHVFANTAGWEASAMVENCTFSGNVTGIFAESLTGNATVRVSDSTIVHNDTGLSASGAGAALLSRDTNTLIRNGTNGSFTGFYFAE